MANIAQVQLLGPTQDTTNTTTVTYTLGMGETVTAGNGVAVYVSAAGSTSCLIASVADSNGNTWVVPSPSGIAPSGSCAATVAYCTKVATALAAGDTITATLSHTSTDKQILVEEYTNQDQSDMLDAAVYVGGLGGAGSTAPTVSTGSTPTSVANELMRCLLTWNGSSALTLDAQLTSLYSGHFDNGGTSQTKQQSLSGKTLSATGTQSVADILAAGQPWAIVMVCWKSTTAPGGGSVKAAARGLSTRDKDSPPSGQDAAYSNRMIDVDWKVIQPTDPTTQGTPALAAAELTRIDGLIDAAHAAGDTCTFRVFAGYKTPDWLKSKVGTFKHADTNSGNTINVQNCPIFWTSTFWGYWDTFMGLLAARYDGGASPTTRQATLRGVQSSGMGGIAYPEALQRHTNAQANRSEMVGGGGGWAGADSNGNGGQTINTPGAGFSFAADQATQRKAIDIHATRWPNTPMHFAFNPWQILLSEQEAIAAGYVTAYQGGNQKYWGGDQPNIPYTKSIIDYAVSVLAPTNRLVLENNSVRASYFSAAGALQTDGQGQMYAYFLTKPCARYYQLATTQRVGDFNTTMKWTVQTLLANACEPTNYSGSTSPYDTTNLASWDTKLRAVALPGGGATAHVPLNLTLPTIDVPSAGYTPTTVLTVHGGTFNAGTHAITKHTFQWYRQNPSTNAVTSVRGPTDDSSSPYSDTYTIQNADLGYVLYATDIATNSDGPSAVAQSLSTSVIATPAAAAPTNTTLPSITPTKPIIGDTLVADHGVWTGSPTTYVYSFLRSTDGGANYSLVQVSSRGSCATQPSDLSALFEVSVVANNGQDSSPAVSLPTVAVAATPVITVTTTATTVATDVTTYAITGSVTARGSGITIASLTVNNSATTVAADGSFSATVSIAAGLNTFVLLATDSAGNTATTTVTIYRTTVATSGDVSDIEIRIHQRGLQ